MIFKESVFSLSRFFHGGKKKLPLWLAGRYFPSHEKNKSSNRASDIFYLKSQGLSLPCQTQQPLQIQTGVWLALRLEKKLEGSIYWAGKHQVLSASSPSKEKDLSYKDGSDGDSSAFKEKAFSFQNKGETLKTWFCFLSRVRDFFESRGLCPVESPSLVRCPGTEPHLQAFKTRFLAHKLKDPIFYLPTSPEMHLKKLLCQDWTDFFEIKKCFRNGELSAFHQPEFTLLEWYRAFFSSQELMEESFKLLEFLQTESFFKIPLQEAKIYSLQELFKEHLGFALQPECSKEDLIPLLQDQKLTFKSEADFDELFFLLFLNCIEPKLPRQRPVFVRDYPPSLRAFSRLNPEGWADRFELYWGGMELANGFYEIRDREEQARQFKAHLQQRKNLQEKRDRESNRGLNRELNRESDREIDQIREDRQLLSLMEGGNMPPSSGVALGLDRLFTLIYQKKNLQEIRLFPLEFPS